MIRYTADTPPRVDRADLTAWQYADKELCDEIDRLQRELAEARAKPCPYVTGGETKHCELAEKDAQNARRYEWLREELDRVELLAYRNGDELDASIDAAMKESPWPVTPRR